MTLETTLIKQCQTSPRNTPGRGFVMIDCRHCAQYGGQALGVLLPFPFTLDILQLSGEHR